MKLRALACPTRTAGCRVDLALFMVEALENDELVHEAPAIVGRQTPSALAHAQQTPSPANPKARRA
jgi:hypothetical protein